MYGVCGGGLRGLRVGVCVCLRAGRGGGQPQRLWRLDCGVAVGWKGVQDTWIVFDGEGGVQQLEAIAVAPEGMLTCAWVCLGGVWVWVGEVCLCGRVEGGGTAGEVVASEGCVWV